jgi:glycosyltransferase involved in cell wall biosynthesis
MSRRRITLLIPIYNESGNIHALVRETDAALAPLDRFEFSYLFVDDGSTDASAQMLERLAGEDRRVGVLELSRNFGKELALTAGLNAVDADAVVIMDADLQHPPAYIPEMIRLWEEGWEIVATKRVRSEKQPLLRRCGSHVFYWLLNAISPFKMEPNTTDFRLLDRVVVEALKRFTETNRMVRGLIDWMGYRKTFIEFEAPSRRAGTVGYTYGRLVRLAIDSFTSFSLVPLKVAGYVGILVTGVFGVLLAFMAVDKLSWNTMGFSPIAFVIVTNVIMNGIVLICLGLVALYIGHIHTEVIGRPLYLVRKAINVRDAGRP